MGQSGDPRKGRGVTRAEPRPGTLAASVLAHIRRGPVDVKAAAGDLGCTAAQVHHTLMRLRSELRHNIVTLGGGRYELRSGIFPSLPAPRPGCRAARVLGRLRACPIDLHRDAARFRATPGQLLKSINALRLRWDLNIRCTARATYALQPGRYSERGYLGRQREPVTLAVLDLLVARREIDVRDLARWSGHPRRRIVSAITSLRHEHDIVCTAQNRYALTGTASRDAAEEGRPMALFKRKRADTGSADARLEQLRSEAAAQQEVHAEARAAFEEAALTGDRGAVDDARAAVDAAAARERELAAAIRASERDVARARDEHEAQERAAHLERAAEHAQRRLECAERFDDLARQLGECSAEFCEATSGIDAELRSAGVRSALSPSTRLRLTSALWAAAPTLSKLIRPQMLITRKSPLAESGAYGISSVERATAQDTTGEPATPGQEEPAHA